MLDIVDIDRSYSFIRKVIVDDSVPWLTAVIKCEFHI